MQIRRRLRLLVVMATALAAITATATPAHAALWQLTDGFESSPLSRWSFTGAGTHFGDFDGHNGLPRNGSKYAQLIQVGKGWSAVGRDVHLTPVIGRTAKCVAAVWLQTGYPSVRVNIEVIDPQSWTYLAVSKVTNEYNPIEWRQFTVGPWTATKADVHFRIALLNDNVKVDDVLIQCTY